MKKIVVALLIFVCAGAALFAQNISMSAGVGGNFAFNFTSTVFTQDYKDIVKPKEGDGNWTLMGYGGSAFFDATFVEASVGVLFGNEKGANDSSKGTDVTALRIGLLGKYPIDMGRGLFFFPTAGVDVMLPLGGKINGTDINDDKVPKEYKDEFNKRYTQIWIKGGVGADIYLMPRVYIRPTFLYGVRFNTEPERDGMSEANKGNDKMISAIVGHGLDIRFAIGYRF